MKQVILSGMQPTGCVTLGNYLGAIKNWALLQDDYDCFYCVVDLHALTVRQNPREFRGQCLNLLAQFLACGLDAEKNTLFFQSHVSGHSELCWLLNCYTYLGELSRMTQFKDKSEKHSDNINAGLMNYPILMAADILLYNASLVPVGEDQKQHLELTRDIAIRFNKIYGDIFTVPRPYIGKTSARIMSLADPVKKMSKSESAGCVTVVDSPDDIMKKFKRAVTDSENVVKYAEGKDGINNLLNIYSAVTGAEAEDAAKMFEGKGYGDFKRAVAEAVIECLRPIQAEYARIVSDEGYLRTVYEKGARSARERSEITLKKVYDCVGLVR